MKTFVVVCLLAMVGTYCHTHRSVAIPPGVVAGAEPRIELVSDKPSWSYKKYTLTPLASCWLLARVLSTERYYFDKESALSPVDLAVGWRGMSDSTYLDHLKVSQSGRWYFFEYKEPVLPDEVISAQSKNIHVIPANAEIAKRAKTVRKDQVVRANGWLVKVSGENGYSWVSSLSTGGSGANSCWVFWIDRLEIENPLVVRLDPVRVNAARR